MNRNAINWFEIPTVDFDRAIKFYSDILGTEIKVVTFGDVTFGMLPSEGEGVQGALIKSDKRIVTEIGILIYINCNPDIDLVLNHVVAHGGSIVMPKIDIGGNGFVAVIKDSEGNSIGLRQTT